MKTLTIYGCSDDLIECEGLPGCDEFYVAGVPMERPLKATLLIRSAEGGLNIHVIYDGGWAFAITTPGEEYPAWEIKRTFGDNKPYSETITVQCPDDATLVFVKGME